MLNVNIFNKMSKSTVVINLLGGPGCGKTTVAAELFSIMKKNKFNVEYVQEYAKKLVILERWEDLNNQYTVSRKQFDLINSLNGKYDYVITDGPLIQGLYYNETNKDNVSNVEKTAQSILKYHHSFTNFNILLRRGDFPYEQTGRYQSEKGAIEIDGAIKKVLDENEIQYTTLVTRDETAREIFAMLKK